MVGSWGLTKPSFEVMKLFLLRTILRGSKSKSVVAVLNWHAAPITEIGYFFSQFFILLLQSFELKASNL